MIPMEVDQFKANLVRMLRSINLTELPDMFPWMLTTNGLITMKSMYADLMNSLFHIMHIWKTKFASKIKVFMGLLQEKVILTKDNLVKCCFCDQEETIHHYSYHVRSPL